MSGKAGMAIAFVALFVAGAGSVEAARLITGKQVKNNSLTTSDIRDGSLLKRDFKPGQLPRGPQGLPGASGRAGRDGFGQVTYKTGQSTGSAMDGATFIACDPGLVPVGGDAYTVDDRGSPVDDVVIAQFFDIRGGSVPNAWTAVYKGKPDRQQVRVEVICVNGSRVSAGSARAAKAAKPFNASPAKPLP